MFKQLHTAIPTSVIVKIELSTRLVVNKKITCTPKWVMVATLVNAPGGMGRSWCKYKIQNQYKE